MEIAGRERAELVCGGRVPGGGLGGGWFYQPTIFAGVKPGSRMEQEEIFGPVLSVIRVDSFEEAVAVNNDVRYGLSSSIYTSNVNLAFRALDLLDTGITYVNAPTIGAEAHLPFGGVKQTGTATARAVGRSSSSIPRPRSATWTTRDGCSARRSIPTAIEERNGMRSGSPGAKGTVARR